ncbi:hypothetical protein C8C83_5104 [Flavobacterium sp. 90]|nr:hypothetical protein C8C82_5451 [Flavobacterium sp. 81]TCK57065.1 hypothetical protein C8C83_5104 [Flavobacterium sp. 90]
MICYLGYYLCNFLFIITAQNYNVSASYYDHDKPYNNQYQTFISVFQERFKIDLALIFTQLAL